LTRSVCLLGLSNQSNTDFSAHRSSCTIVDRNPVSNGCSEISPTWGLAILEPPGAPGQPNEVRFRRGD
jgi:hypothetical protein